VPEKTVRWPFPGLTDMVIVGPGALIVHVDVATWVAIPFASSASTRNVCGPTARPV
jgi:hypothetical protein